MRRLLSVLVASAVAAAFLGPGTVTTAARAGASSGYALLWALLFSTAACLVLQEASARLTVVSGHSLGEALRLRFPAGPSRRAVVALVLGAVVLGCAAYEAGNILGGVAGLELATGLSQRLLTLLSAAAAGLLLWLGSTRAVVTVLSALVGVMGAAFLFTAALLRPPVGELAAGLFLPSLPSDAGLLVLGLVGTTVVPYNLFLGSGLARGQSLGEARFGLAVAVGLGGLISMGVVVVGRAVTGDFSFAGIAEVLAARLGGWAATLFAAGLFAAGFSSAITAPFAAALAARGLLAAGAEDPRWGEHAPRYRGVWLGVLLFGAACGVTGIRPIPAILAAQALNGVLLPLVALFLLVMVNDRPVVGAAGLNGALSNLGMGAAVAVTVLLGLLGLVRAVASTSGWQVDERWVVAGSGAVVLLGALPVARWLAAGRAGRSRRPPIVSPPC